MHGNEQSVHHHPDHPGQLRSASPGPVVDVGSSRRDPPRIVLAAAEGATNAGIAAAVGVHVDTVRKWRCRFADAGLPGLEDSPRSGRRRAFTPVQVAEVKALACTLPAETGAPLSRWSSADLATEAITRGIAETISAQNSGSG